MTDNTKPIRIEVDTEQEREEIEEILVEVAERPQLYDTEAKERFVDAEVVVRDRLPFRQP